ncbi:TPA: hypothetical protein ACHH6L_005056 [Escherichia coli]
MPKIIRALSADAHLVVSLLCRETVRSCGGLNGAELSALQTYLVRAAPRHPHQCVRAQCGFRFSSASSPTRSLRSVAGAAASGVTSRMLSVIPLLFFQG